MGIDSPWERGNDSAVVVGSPPTIHLEEFLISLCVPHIKHNHIVHRTRHLVSEIRESSLRPIAPSPPPSAVKLRGPLSIVKITSA